MQNIELDLATIVILSWENRFAAAGGVRAVTQEYANHLVTEGRKALVVTPLHKGLKNPPGEVAFVSTITLDFDGVRRQVAIREAEWDQVRWIYLDCDDFFNAEGGRDRSNPYLYAQDAEDEARGNGSPCLVRDSLLFAAAMPGVLAALEILDNLVLHLQDWETCAVALTIKDAVDRQEIGRAVSSLALHNPYDSRMNPPRLENDGWNLISTRAIPAGVPLTFLGRLIPLIDAPPTTVSREFAVDLMSDPLQTEHLADHLQAHFHRRGITGVDNGPFGHFEKPFTEDAIRDAREGKPQAILKQKQGLRQRMVETMRNYRPHERWGDIEFDALSPDRSTSPVFVCVGRLDEGQKGYDVLARAIEVLLKEHFDGYFILTPIVGNAPQPYVDDLEQLGKNFEGRVVVYPMRMEKGYLEIQVGSSFSLWPSMYEPFGGVSEFLLKGTPVIARSTGGLRQQITNFDNASGKGNGVLYETCLPDPGGASFHHGTRCQNEWRAIQMEEYPRCRMRYPVYKDQVAQLIEAIKRGVGILGDPIAHGRLLSNLYDSVSGYSWSRAQKEYFENYVRR